MSEEQRKDETEVEGHGVRASAHDEPRDEAETDDEVEGHGVRASAPKSSAPKSS
jgi:hypothetical protein